MKPATHTLVLVDTHDLLASSLAVALGHSGFERVTTVDPDALDLDDNAVPELAPGDIVLLGLLYGDGRTTVSLIRPLAERGCRVMVMTSDMGQLLGDPGFGFTMPAMVSAWGRSPGLRPCLM